jgi:hypothetical protein
MTPLAELIDDLRLLEPPNPWLLYYWAGGAVLALLFLLLLVRMIRSWRRRPGAVSERQVRAAQEDALASLQELFAMVEEGQGKPYAIESSRIIRTYVERRFDIGASRRSTEEFLHEVQYSPQLAPENQELLGQFLNFCDYLKFARGIASQEELEGLHAAAVQFITETRAGVMEGQA